MMHVHGHQPSFNTMSVIFQSCIFLSYNFSRPLQSSASSRCQTVYCWTSRLPCCRCSYVERFTVGRYMLPPHCRCLDIYHGGLHTRTAAAHNPCVS